ncbi:nuclear transport factor 2 family protein [Geothrix fuzhouensis]|uniref:nuclear transport factor 2 family protein n=1 Tax=Geothrix fuzhouensis TaxID=2966451 RepID=UPI002147EBA8|nr:nuclear transport factor 2 family protein [Geothrix fuzhouensis]
MPRGALKSSLLLVGTLGMAEAPEDATPMPAALSVRSTPRTDGIASVVEHWAKAWLDGNSEAMLACLHPALAKHILGLETPPSQEALQRLIGVQSILGKAVRDRISEADVKVLDVQGRSGSARVDLGPWTAFIHLAAHHDGWAIANVLWEWRS